MNNFILVGRIDEILTGINYYITLEVYDPYKNKKGEYEKNFIDVVLNDQQLIETAKKYNLKKGDMIGVKGRIERKQLQVGNQLIAEKLTFLTNNNE